MPPANPPPTDVEGFKKGDKVYDDVLEQTGTVVRNCVKEKGQYEIDFGDTIVLRTAGHTRTRVSKREEIVLEGTHRHTDTNTNVQMNHHHAYFVCAKESLCPGVYNVKASRKHTRTSR